MNVSAKIETLLFVASRPLAVKKIGEIIAADEQQVRQAIDELKLKYNRETSGIQIVEHGRQVQMVSSPLHAKVVADFLKQERSGDLTRPALETLTIIAYRGPLPKSEIDLLRGVNCSLILRHLLVRGLIAADEDQARLATVYEVSFDFLRHLGLRTVSELPEYDTLHHDKRLEEFLQPKDESAERDQPADTSAKMDKR